MSRNKFRTFYEVLYFDPETETVFMFPLPAMEVLCFSPVCAVIRRDEILIRMPDALASFILQVAFSLTGRRKFNELNFDKFDNFPVAT